MKPFSLESNPLAIKLCEPESILTDWLTAIARFHDYYYQLITCSNQSVVDFDSDVVKAAYIGQCPVSQLAKLTTIMSRELEMLNQDIDQIEELRTSDTRKKYNLLVTHTRLLNRLNQRAQSGLYLVNLPSS